MGIAPRGAGPNRGAIESAGQPWATATVEPSTRFAETVTAGRWTASGLRLGRQVVCRQAMSKDHDRRVKGPAELDVVRVGASWAQSPKVAVSRMLAGSACRRSATTVTRAVIMPAK